MQAVTKDQFLHTAVNIQLYTGLRIGELLALRWNDVDFATGEIRVDEALVFKEMDKNGKMVMGTVIEEPKTPYSLRSIGFADKLKSILLDWRRYLEKNGYPESVLAGDGIILCKQKGSYYTESGYRNRLKKLLIREGAYVQGICPYSFRHAFAENMFEAGKSIREIQMLMGHESIQTTFNYLRKRCNVDLKVLAERLDDYMTEREKKYESAEKSNRKTETYSVYDKGTDEGSLQIFMRTGRVKCDRQRVENLKNWRATRVQPPKKEGENVQPRAAEFGIKPNNSD